MNWFYAVGQQRLGPVSEEQLLELIRSGQVTAETLVWKEGMANWQRVVEVQPEWVPGAELMETCAVDGKAYPRRRMLQYQDKWIAAENRDIFFQRMREGVTAPGEMAYAGFWIRVLAKMVDVLLLYAVGLLKTFAVIALFTGSGAFFNTPPRDPSHMASYFGMVALDATIGILIGLGYYWFFLARYEATVGKLICGLKVVRADGSRLGTGRIIGRHFAEWISSMVLGIGYLLVAFDEEEKRSLHDRICDTRVIKKR